MNLRDLQYLCAIAEHAHIGRASLACNVSQPTMSMQIKKLEEELGIQLLERAHRRVKLTAHGEAIAARAARVMQEATALKDLARSLRDPLAGECKLGAFPTLAPYYLPKIVPRISKALPKIELLLVEDKTERLLASLGSGELDCALIALPIDTRGLESVTLFQEPFLLAVPANHALAARKYVTPKDIAQERMLLLEDGHCLRDQALDVCSVIGVREQTGFRATSLETLRQVVAAGVGVTLIPQCAITDTKTVKMIPFKGNPYTRTIGLVWRSTHPRKALINTVAKAIS